MEDRDTLDETLNVCEVQKRLSNLQNIPFFEREKGYEIKDIKCGGNHTLLLLENGLLLASGEMHELKTPLHVNEGWMILNYELNNLLHKEYPNGHSHGVIDAISTGWESSYVSIRDKYDNVVNIFSFGQQSKTKLGRADNNGTFKILTSKHGCVSSKIISCLYTNIVFFEYETQNSELYGWGSNTKEQLTSHIDKSYKKIASPTLIGIFDVNTHIEFGLGKDFMVIINYTDKSVNIRGNSKIKNAFSETDIDFSKIAKWCTLWSSIHFIDKQGLVTSIGNGQLGQTSMNGKYISNVQFFIGGSEHIICTSSSKPLVVESWGWGEHGNCGKLHEAKPDADQTIFNTPNLIVNFEDITNQEENKNINIKNIYGGCATTFILIENY